MKLFDLYATLGLDASGFKQGISSAKSAFSAFSSGIGSGVKGVGGTVGGVVSTVIRSANAMETAVASAVKRTGVAFSGLMGSLTVTGIKYNSMMENYTMDFTTLLQDAEKAEAKVEELRGLDLSTPLDFETLASATKMMLNFGISEDEASAKLTQLSDIAMGNKEKFDSLTLAFSQIRSVGKLTMMDLRQMANQGFNPLQIVAEQTGVAIGDLQEFMSYGKPSKDMTEAFRQAQDEVRKLGDNASLGSKMLAAMAEEGIISADIVAQAIDVATGEGGRFYKATENAAKTLTGQWSMLQGGVKKLIGSGFEPLSEALTNDILPNLNTFVDELDAAFNTYGGGNSGLVAMLAVTRDELYKIRENSDEIGENLSQNIIKGMRTGALSIKTFNGILPDLLSIGRDAFTSFRTGFKDAVVQLSNSAEIIAPDLIAGAIGLKGDFLVAGLDIAGGIAKGIAKDFGPEGEGQILNTLTSTLTDVFSSVGQNAEIVADGAGKIVEGFASWFTSGDNGDALLSAGFDAVSAIGSAIISNSDEVVSAAASIASKLVGALPGEIMGLLSTWGDELGLAVANIVLPGEYETQEELYAAMGLTDAMKAAELAAKNVPTVDEIFDDPSILLDYSSESAEYIKKHGGSTWSMIQNAIEYSDSMKQIGETAEETAEKVTAMQEAFDEMDGTRVDTYVNTHFNYVYDHLYYGTGGAGKLPGAGTRELGVPDYVPGYSTGLDFVPYNNFLARLHEGEAVLTKAEANRWRREENIMDVLTIPTAQDDRPIMVNLDGKALVAAITRQMGKSLGNRNLQQIMALGG